MTVKQIVMAGLKWPPDVAEQTFTSEGELTYVIGVVGAYHKGEDDAHSVRHTDLEHAGEANDALGVAEEEVGSRAHAYRDNDRLLSVR